MRYSMSRFYIGSVSHPGSGLWDQKEYSSDSWFRILLVRLYWYHFYNPVEIRIVDSKTGEHYVW